MDAVGRQFLFLTNILEVWQNKRGLMIGYFFMISFYPLYSFLWVDKSGELSFDSILSYFFP